MTKNWRPFAFLLASVALAALCAPPALADKRVALVIGNSNYARVNPLKNPANDAPDLESTLKGLGFDVILRMNASKSEFERALAEFSRRSTGADVTLFYYAGHGVQRREKNYLLPTDIEVRDQADVTQLAVKLDSVREAMEESGGVKILILDACRDNPFEKLIATRSVAGGSLTRGLGRIDRAEGMLVAYAAGPNQVAMDGAGRNSPFAEALMRRLREPGVEIEAMFKKVRNDVVEITDGKQWPEVSSMVRGDFFLTPDEGDRRAWERAEKSQDPADYKKLIADFPNSPFAIKAQFRLDLFERIRRENEEKAEREARLAQEKAAAERRRAEQREAEIREATRLAAEKAEAQRREAERLAQEKAEAERRALARQEAEKREAARLAAEKAEAERQKAERIVAEKREAERLAAEKAEAQRKEAERLAAEKSEKARIAAEKGEAERKEAERLAAERRAAEEQKKLATLEATRETERARKQAEEICAREGIELKTISTARQPNALEEFRKRVSCPTIGPAIDREAETIRKALARACDADRKALAAIKDSDLAALRAAAGQTSCETAREDASKRIAKLEEAERRAAEACVEERRSLEAIEPTSFGAQEQYWALRGKLTCSQARANLENALGAIDRRVLDAQKQLARLGCYSGAVTGKLDEATRKSMTLYAGKKGFDEAREKLTDNFLSELKNQNFAVCPPATPPVASTSAPANSTKDKPAVHTRTKIKEKRPEVARHRDEERPRKQEIVRSRKLERPVARIRAAPSQAAQAAPKPLEPARVYNIYNIGH